jgi:CDP-paratose 2-epimerase
LSSLPDKILISGGAGFVGSNLALAFRRESQRMQITVLDNLTRRGSELNLPRFRDANIQFVHGDIRCPEDLQGVPEFELLVDCSAEPSVHAGASGSPRGVLNTNLVGTLHCLDLATERGAKFLFLSTSRVYPLTKLNDLSYRENETRFVWEANQGVPGFSTQGVSETFTLDGPRSFYGASKLASELLIAEYVHSKNLKAIINRCGILSGPWQMGRVDQGVMTLWAARHIFGRPLAYIGFGGTGKQVRDLLHVDDLFELLKRQIQTSDDWRGEIYNVGGGTDVSLSLVELTELCQRFTKKTIPIGSQPETHPLDVRIYASDCERVTRAFDWRPVRTAPQIIEDIVRWIVDHQAQLRPILA